VEPPEHAFTRETRMITKPGSITLIAALSVMFTLSPDTATAQIIQIKTVPVATGDQFLIHPTARMGMANVSIALDDPLLDPFVNPALGSALEQSRLFGAPSYYRIANGNGSGRTLPLGIMIAGQKYFGTASVALQQLQPANRWGAFCCFGDGTVGRLQNSWVDPSSLRDRSATNMYASGSLGRRIGDGRTAIGISAAYSGLDALDGVDLLYASSQSIRQDGHSTDFRLGLTRAMGAEQRLDLLLMHSRIDMTHDVRYVDVTWSPTWQPTTVIRDVLNHDQTRIWGAQAGYTRPLEEDGWRAGLIGRINYMTHPKIPDYEIMNIPRDPGHSWAYNLGLGSSREDGPVSFGIDVVYEPIWSNTWADTEAEITTPGGTIIPAGGKTVENDFRFNNAHLRIGAGREAGRLGFQLGLHVRSISYEMDQYNFITASARQQSESWMEWTPSWGLVGRFPELEVRYSGRYISGTGRPGLAFTGFADGARLASANFILAPAGPLNLQESGVLSHQVAVSVPIGARR